MAGPKSTGTTGLIARQVRRARGRQNLSEAQRALYHLVALLAGAGAGVVLLALRATPRGFAVAAGCLGAATIAGGALVARGLGRRWVRARDAATWIDRSAGLRGRLATLVEVGNAQPSFFLPLLAAQNAEALPRWAPRRLVPYVVPRGALATALAATAGLVAVVLLAPRLRPPRPEIFYSDRPVEGVALRGYDEVPGRILLAPAGPGEPAEDGGMDLARAARDEIPDSRGRLDRLSADLQERLRRELWGESWEAERDATMRAEQQRARAGAADEESDAETSPGEGAELARLTTDPSAPGEATGAEGPQPGATRTDDDGDAAARPGDPGEADGESAAHGAAGAGTSTDPNLFGQPSETGPAGARFELALSARVHDPRGGSHRPAGEAPPPAPDARPNLAARSRAEAAQQHMPVPPAYEAIVREVFAHRETPP